MLTEIRIRGLGVISDAVLEFGPGLTVVTGETGAGKTMVVSGLALLFGGRADYSKLRPGVESASVEGLLTIEPNGVAAAVVIDAGGDLDPDGGLVLRRVIAPSGRSRAAVGGASVPAAVLSRLGTELLAVHGQSDQQRLTLPAEQRTTLDRYAGIDLAECRACYQRWREAVAELQRRTGAARELAREADLLRHGIAEIEAVAPQPGEDAELAAEVSRLDHADALRIAAHTAHDLLRGDAQDPTADAADVVGLAGLAYRALNQMAETDPDLDALGARLAEITTVASDLGGELADYEAKLEADPARLAAANDRRAALNGLIRKYGPDLDAVLAWAADAERRLAESDTSEHALAALAASRDAALADYRFAAEAVSTQRRTAASELSDKITTELAGLAMPTARVTVEVSLRPVTEAGPSLAVEAGTAGAGPDGVDEVSINLQAHPDAPALAVQRGASGGELSRVMLAIEVVLAGTDPVPTMVFDEVDAGVGGRAAAEVGRRLARLARNHQVVVVTHLAQVAAFADRHLVVDKTVSSPAADQSTSENESTGVTRSDIRAVDGEERVIELARMLAGADTPVAREHAAELLAAGTEKPVTGRRRKAVRGTSKA
ncbi:MAG TPA: DNA repair protein RecN [Jatrophihabitans sp.]